MKSNRSEDTTVSSRRWLCGEINGTGGTGNSTALGNMMAVAARIQERAKRLFEEQTNLHDAKVKLEQSRTLREQETQRNREAKRRMLEASIARNQVELNLFDVQDKIKEQQIKNQEMEKKTRCIKEVCDTIQSQFNSDVETLYAPHEMEMESFRKVLEAKKEMAQKQHDRLDRIESRLHELEQAQVELSQDKKSLTMEREEFQNEERQGVHDIAALAVEVRQALTQRSELRQSIRDAKENLRNMETEIEADVKNI